MSKKKMQAKQNKTKQIKKMNEDGIR
jgi:hypothetical protein